MSVVGNMKAKYSTTLEKRKEKKTRKMSFMNGYNVLM